MLEGNFNPIDALCIVLEYINPLASAIGWRLADNLVGPLYFLQ